MRRNMSDKVFIIKTKDDIQKWAFLAPLATSLLGGGAAAAGGAAAGGAAGLAAGGAAAGTAATGAGLAAGTTGAGLAAGTAGTSALGTAGTAANVGKLGQMATKVKNVSENPSVKRAAKAKELSDQQQQQKVMQEQQQLEGAQESASRAREEAKIATGEPMNLAWRLLKEDDLPDMSKFGLPVQRPTSITYADGVKKPIPYEYRGPKYEYRSPTNEREIRTEAEKQRRARLHEERMGEKRERFFERWGDGNYQPPEVSPTMNEVSPTMNEVENQPTWPTSTPYNEKTGFTRSEPMEIAMRLLKRELHPGENQYKHRYKMPNRDDVHPEWYDWIQETLDNPAEYEGIADDFQQPDINHLAGATSREEFFEKLYDLHNFQVDDARPPFDDIEGKYRDFTDVPFSEETGFTRSEPMKIAMQLLKERVSPEAIAHKLAYDKKYESTPERVKYREELNRERRRRHIMGQGGPDMSHTKDHTIVPEDPHTNRARHFKDKGTLL